MRYFRVDYGFDGGRIIPIDETELEKAIYAHITGKTVVFKNGSVSGNHIIAIAPDFHRELGWSYDHKFDNYDWKDLEPIERRYTGVIAAVKEKITYLIQTKQEHLIGKDITIPELAQPELRRSGDEVEIGSALGNLTKRLNGPDTV